MNGASLFSPNADSGPLSWLRAHSLASLRRRLMLVFWAGALIAIVLIGWALYRDLDLRLEQKHHELISLSYALQQSATHRFDSADRLLERMVDAARDGGLSAAAALKTPQMIRELASDETLRPRGFFLSADGSLYGDSHGLSVSPFKEAPDFLQWHLHDADPLTHVGARFTDAQTQTRWIPLTRRVSRVDGSVLGVLGVLLQARDFEQRYASLHLGDGRILLFNTESGAVLAAYPAQSGDPILEPGDPLLRNARAMSSEQPYTLDRTQDRSEHRARDISVVQRLDDWPVAIALIADTGPVYAAWYAEMIKLLAALFIMLTIGGVLFRALLNYLRRLEAGREELEITKFTLDQSSDAVYWVDQQGRFAFANPSAADWFETPLAQLPGAPIAFFFPALEGEAYARRFDELRTCGSEVKRLEYRAADGTLKTGEAHLRHMVYRGAEYVCVVLRDLSGSVEAESALHVSEQRYEVAVLGSEVGIWDYDYQSGALYRSPQLLSMHGLGPQHALSSGQAVFDELSDELQARFRTEATEAIKTHRRFSVEYSHQMIDGSTRWFRVSGAASYDRQGAPTRLAGSLIDITHSKQIELELRADQRRREIIFQRSPLGMLVSRRHDGRIAEANASVLKMTGLRLEQVIGHTSIELGFWRDAAQRTEALSVMPLVIEQTFKRPDGETAYLLCYCQDIDIDGEDYLIVSMQDITERRHKEEALRASEARFARLLEMSPLAVVISSMEENRTLDVNAAFTEVTGYTREEALARTLDELALWSEPGASELYVQTLRQSGRAAPRDLAIRHKSGVLSYVELSGLLIDVETETRILSFMRDITQRKLAEIELLRSRERLSRIIHASPTAMSITDLDDGGVIDVNDAWLRMFRFRREMVIGRTLAELGADVSERAWRLEALRRGVSMRDLDIECTRADGERFETRCSFETLLLDGRTVLVSTLADVTEQKRTERELNRRDDLLRQTGAVAKVGGWELDPQTGAMQWTDEQYRIHGMPPGSPVPSFDEMMERYDGETRLQLKAAIEKTVNTGEPLDLELPFYTVSGLLRWGHIQGVAERREGESVRLYGAFQDVTERRLQGEWLRESEARFARIFDSTPAGVLLFRLSDESIVDANPALCRMGGFARDEVIGTPARKLGERLSTAAFERALARGKSLSDQWTTPEDFAFHAADGRTGYLSMTASLFEYGGEPLGLVFIQDISEWRRAADEIHRLNETLEFRVRERTAQLEAANRELEAFSYSVSHDLRAPLRAMTGFSTILVDEHRAELNPQATELLMRVSAASQRMADLIDALLQLARVTQQQMKRAAVDFSALAQAVIKDLRDAEPQRQADIHIQPELKVDGDPALMRSLLQNLLGNAWKYSAKNDITHIEFGCTQMQGESVFYIRDQGVGFDMRYATRLFGAFQRLHSSKDFEGTGIGLATVERIVRRHGGRIWAESQPQQGATFYFTLL